MRLNWGMAGERRFESGIDRGVLYPRFATAAPWVGITNLEEDFAEDGSDPVYFDGVKIRDDEIIGDFAAQLSAFTYPEEFDDIQGIRLLSGGLYADDQQTSQFDLCFRTQVGNDVDGLEHGYKLHLIYNLSVIPVAVSRQTHTETITPFNFEWSISAVPENVPGYRPTAHFIIESNYVDSDVLTILEEILYGDEDTAPRMIGVTELMQLGLSGAFTIVDNGDDTLTLTSTYDDTIIDLGDGLYELHGIVATPVPGDEGMFTINTS